MVIILHNIRSMHNVGSIFRTADAAGIEKIYLHTNLNSFEFPWIWSILQKCFVHHLPFNEFEGVRHRINRSWRVIQLRFLSLLWCVIIHFFFCLKKLIRWYVIFSDYNFCKIYISSTSPVKWDVSFIFSVYCSLKNIRIS